MTSPPPNPDSPDGASSASDRAPLRVDADSRTAARDIAEVPAVEVVTTVALHLMSAAAVQLGLGDPQDPGEGLTADQPIDLDEARTLITALAGLVTASAPRLGTFHAAPLRDGLRTLQLAFREASPIPDGVGLAPGEELTGPVGP